MATRPGLTRDAIVGPDTFGRADNNLVFSSVDNDAVGHLGEDVDITFYRDDTVGTGRY
ncbi:hypothetical protein [Streptomyces sp. YKOK-I1]